MDAATSATDSSPPSRRRPAPCEERTSPCPAAGASTLDTREEKGEDSPFLSKLSIGQHAVREMAGARGGGHVHLFRRWCFASYCSERIHATSVYKGEECNDCRDATSLSVLKLYCIFEGATKECDSKHRYILGDSEAGLFG